MPRLEFWFEFASTYSYLSAMRVEHHCQEAGVALIWQPFLLGPVFKAQGWKTSPFNIYPAKGRYMWRDLDRRAAAIGLPPITQPEPFPQNGLLAARLTLIGLEDTWGAAFVRAVYAAQFAEGKDISDPATLHALLADLDLPADALIDRARTDGKTKNALRDQTDAAIATGIFGAPTFRTETDELFWGDDRLEDALIWAKTPGA